MGASEGSRHQQQVGRAQNRIWDTRSGAGIVVGVFVTLLILSLWLHFIVAQETELIGREIQSRTAELERIGRENMALRRQIAAAYSEEVMAERARTLGYRPQQPLYLLLNRPLVPVAGGSRTDALIQPSIFRDAPPGAGTGPDSGGEGAPITVGRP